MNKKNKMLGFVLLLIVNVLLFLACDNNDDSNGNNGNNDNGSHDTNIFTVTNTEEWDNMCQKIYQGGNNKNYTITIVGNINLGPSNWNSFRTENSTITLKGNGTLSTNSSANSRSILGVGGNQKLIIDGPSLIDIGNGSGISVQNGDAELINGTISCGYAGVRVSNNGTFIMSGGTISGNNYGVDVWDANFIMNGGNISNNIGSDGYGVRVVTSNNSVTNSIFNMTNGTISGNTSNHAGGGGVYIVSSTFTLSGGTISGNTASHTGNVVGVGGGVNVINGIFNMTGGNIINNDSTAWCGGGINIEGGTFNMSGGIIGGNSSSFQGGGVYIRSSVNFNKTGGIIYGNNEGINSNIANLADRNNNIAHLYNNGGHAVYWEGSEKYRNATLGINVNISTNVNTSPPWNQ